MLRQDSVGLFVGTLYDLAYFLVDLLGNSLAVVALLADLLAQKDQLLRLAKRHRP
jgi:hypothetical protein